MTVLCAGDDHYDSQCLLRGQKDHLIDELQVASHTAQRLAAGRRLPQKHGEVI